MRRNELDQFRNVRLVLKRARVNTVLLQAISPEVLECQLHVVDGILIVHLVQEELLELEKLIALNIFDLFSATDVVQLLHSRREFEVDEGMDAIEDAVLADGVCVLVRGLRVYSRLSCCCH